MATIGLALGGVSAAGLAAGLGGLAVAGAVGLGVAALARRGRRRGGFRRRGHRRFGREVAQEDDQAALNRLLALVRQEDATGCGLRLMCELAANPDHQLPQEAREILSLVGSPVKPGEGVLPPGGAGDYLEAKSVGYFGGDCVQTYPLCPQDGAQLLGSVMAHLP
ncbi:uncharacterized protein [Panulirus ornatus]|uniref:uncharacterized protein n=1 Tax=Panulirus ornatus TaxID=150431 RepID=UPI003A83A078